MVSSTGSRAWRRVRVWGLGKNVVRAERERGVGLWDEKRMRWREGLGRERRAGRDEGLNGGVQAEGIGWLEFRLFLFLWAQEMKQPQEWSPHKPLKLLFD